jgi:hypothetical protein
MYYPSLMLMPLAEERVPASGRRAFHADLRSPEPGRTRGTRRRPWPARAYAALSGRTPAGRRRAGLATARAHS